jgi:hypothetical protein
VFLTVGCIVSADRIEKKGGKNEGKRVKTCENNR